MKKFIKPMIIGAGIYGLCEFSWQFGKGHMLGVLYKHNLVGDDVMNIFINSDEFISRFIGKVAKDTINEKYYKNK